MSAKRHDRAARNRRTTGRYIPQPSAEQSALVFSALGDQTRLTLLTKLADGSLLSITELAANSTLTRQAITKHLRVLEGAGLIRGHRRGRETRFQFEPTPLDEARRSLDKISVQWDQALARLKSYVER